jgi:hypothetical protein
LPSTNQPTTSSKPRSTPDSGPSLQHRAALTGRSRRLHYAVGVAITRRWEPKRLRLRLAERINARQLLKATAAKTRTIKVNGIETRGFQRTSRGHGNRAKASVKRLGRLLGR